ncbi:MAG TPA: uroporphyrinogen-III synthase [Meiothermus sp.]|nr:uroporphyrinogen-III synthase [Meiothermus sp.]
MRVALTHSEGRLEGLEARLEALSYRVFRHPLISTQTLTGVSLEPLEPCCWWLFSSQAAVRAVAELGGRLEGHPIGAVGASTAKAVQGLGLEVELVSPDGNAESLARAFIAQRAPGPVGLPQGNRASPALADALTRAGYEVRTLTVYQTLTHPWPSDAPIPDFTVLASPSAVEALPTEVARQTHCIALGPSTAQSLRARGLVFSEAPSPSVEGVLEAIEGAKQASLSPALWGGVVS